MSAHNSTTITGHSKSEGQKAVGEEKDNTMARKIKEQQIEIEILHQKNELLQECLKRAYDDIDDRHALSEYASLIIEASPSTINSQYVLRLQSQLHKSLHKMGMLQNQMDLVKAQTEEAIKTLQLKLVEQMEAHLHAEQNTFKDLIDMEEEMRGLKERHSLEIREHQQLISELREQLDCATLKPSRQSSASEVKVIDGAMKKDEKNDESQDFCKSGGGLLQQQKDLLIGKLLTQLGVSQEKTESRPVKCFHPRQNQHSTEKDTALAVHSGPVVKSAVRKPKTSHARTA